MKTDEVVVDENEDEKKSPVIKKAAVEERKTYNVNDITINKMLQQIKEYKDKDDIAKVNKEKMNEKNEQQYLLQNI